jgi:hypothetical protein
MLAMQVDDLVFGDLAKPRKRFAFAQVKVGQSPHCFGARFLENVIRLDLPPQGRTKLPLDKRHELRAVRLQKFGQRVGIAAAEAVFNVVEHGGPPGGTGLIVACT